jgi:signal transduction histidine kinase
MREEMVHHTMWRKLLDALPHGHYLAEEDWQRRHRLMLWILGLHAPGLLALGLALGYTPRMLTLVVIPPLALVGLGHLLRHHRRPTSITVTVGLVYCSAALVVLTHGTIEAHFHFFVIIGFIALYQDWAPFLVNIVFTVISHGIGSAWQQTLIFDHVEGQEHPWLWSLIHGVAVLVACAGALLVLRVTEDTQREKDVLGRRLADSEINRRQFTSDLLTNLARRNQGLLHRQLEIINQLEESERDPDALSDLFALDHIATRVRRNAENLLVLAGEQPPRTWSEPVPLRDVLRAAIAETENLERVVFVVDEKSAVVGHTVIDLTHLLAELTENAVRFSPPDTTVTVRSRPDRARPGGRLISIEDWGLGMPAEQIEQANALLASPPDIDVGMSQRLGFHVVARLATRHGIKVGLSVTPGSGTTALVSLPPSLFAPLYPAAAASASGARPAADHRPPRRAAAHHTTAAPPPVAAPSTAPPRTLDTADWQGWWDPAVASAMPAFNPTPAPVSGAGPAIGDPPSNGYGNGSAAHPTAGLGPAANGHGSNGHGSNGHGSNGHGASDGYGTNGHATPTPSDASDHDSPAADQYGSTADGVYPAADGADQVGSGAGAVDARFSELGPTDTGPIRVVVSADDVDVQPRGEGSGGRSYDPFFVSSLWGADGTPHENANREGAGLGPGTSTPTYRASTGSSLSSLSSLSTPSTSTPSAPAEETRQAEPLRPRPSPSPRPLVVDALPLPTATVPEQRPSGPVDPVSGLRRRVPQSHLSAQLRTPEPEAAPIRARPSTADAAAALSRYQASRAAAQARVGGTLPTGPATTDDHADGAHE